VTPWMLAVLGLLPPFIVAVAAASVGGFAQRLAGLQLAIAIVAPLLVLMTFAFDQSALIDLALAVALLAAPGTLLVSLFLERWL
jgi:multisubunit Na+/H+ antiporter MnhF subunit